MPTGPISVITVVVDTKFVEGHQKLLPASITELTLRTDELAELASAVTTVFVVENEVTYLAFPEVATQSSFSVRDSL